MTKLTDTMGKALDSLYEQEQRDAQWRARDEANGTPRRRRPSRHQPSVEDSRGRNLDGERMGRALVKRDLAVEVGFDGEPVAPGRHGGYFRLTAAGVELAAARVARRKARQAQRERAREAFDAEHDVYLVHTEVVVSVPVAVAAASEAEAAALAMMGKGKALRSMRNAEVVARGVRRMRKAPEVKAHRLDERFTRWGFVSLSAFDGHCDECGREYDDKGQHTCSCYCPRCGKPVEYECECDDESEATSCAS